MDAAGGRESASLKHVLFSEPDRFDFFQAVRALQCFSAPTQRVVGHDISPAQETVQFRAAASLSFASSPISELQQDGPAVQMGVTFMGLTGPTGALPHHYTAMLIEQLKLKNDALRDFLDLFNHRLISLFYRAWEKCRFPISYEAGKHSTSSRDDRYCTALFSLVGLGSPGLRRRLDGDDEMLLYYAGTLAHYPRSAVSLEMAAGELFSLPVRIEQFRGQWLLLGAENRTSLPGPRNRNANARLGQSVVLGERVWDVQSRFRVRLGPMGYARFCSLIPGGPEFTRFMKFIRLYVGPEFDFEIQPVLLAAEVPGCRLGQHDGHAQPALGRNVWVRSGRFDADFDGAVFESKEI